jgi:hypothetical protein
MLLVFPTLFLAIAAWKQLPLLQKQIAALGLQISEAQKATFNQLEAQRVARQAEEWRQIESNTLHACEAYYSNSVLYTATKSVFEGSSKGTKYSKEDLPSYQHDLLMTINYLNGIATGVAEGVLSGDIVKDNLENTITKVVDVIIPALIDRPENFKFLIKLRREWENAVPSYKRGPH